MLWARKTALAILCILIHSCGKKDEGTLTPAERQRRQDLTWDLSGKYVENLTEGEPSVVNIENEAGFHDIKANFRFGGELTELDTEDVKQTIRKHDVVLSASQHEQIIVALEAQLRNVDLGTGATFRDRGGENIVLDAVGEVSEVALDSKSYVFYEVPLGSNKAFYLVKLDLRMTTYRGEDRFDFEITQNTDTAGKNAAHTKGLLMTINRRQEDSNGRVRNIETMLSKDLKLGEFRLEK